MSPAERLKSPRSKNSPQLTLDVKRVSLLKNGVAEPLRGEWVEKLPAREGEADRTNVGDAASIGSGRWQLAAETEYLQVYENTRALPRVWLAVEEFVAKEQDELEIIRTGKLPDGKSWDPLQTVLVEAPTSSVFGASMIRGSADVTRHEPNRVEVKTASVATSILVLSENHYPGWRAYVDGKSVDVMRVNYNLRGVAVPAGNHVVVFVYRPKSVLAGLVISLLTLGLLLFWWSGSADKTFKLICWDRGRPARKRAALARVDLNGESIMWWIACGRDARGPSKSPERADGLMIKTTKSNLVFEAPRFVRAAGRLFLLSRYGTAGIRTGSGALGSARTV